MRSRPPLPGAAVAALACPVCTAALAVDGDVLRCPAGHAYDRARQGHVTLLPPGHRPPSGDSAEMVADRASFLAAGHYAGVTAALGDAVTAGEGRQPEVLLDLGGGTGHHLAAVLARVPAAAGVVLDSSTYAARRAARAHPRAMAVVADTWARLPVRDEAVDRVLVVFAPRNGAEIARVLRPDGRLVVVTPAPDHLGELVGPLGLLRVDPDKSARLAASLEPHLRRLSTTAHRERLRLDRAAVGTLVGMGPHARHLSGEQLAGRLAVLPDPVEVTVAVEVAVYGRPGRGPDDVRAAREPVRGAPGHARGRDGGGLV
ncbi:putative RNA methyltransferase [Blastococcus sp. CCUG 61487]|uniref:putative RNA methyltransferase n=1 Tax=Blastococcus sp. CCUG 61487 TaxID=1840703 RepID=UPI0010C04DAE|nr:methyltransferase domain-containing protein [Blastococcus sp. CCUG 61487]